MCIRASYGKRLVDLRAGGAASALAGDDVDGRAALRDRPPAFMERKEN